VDCVGHEFLAGAALAADEHGGVALGDLGDLVVDRLHDPRVAHDVGGLEPLLELVLEAEVVLDKSLPLGLSRLPEAHGLGDHRGDDGQQADVLLELDAFGEQAVGAEGPDDLVAELDRHAEKRDILLCQVFTGAGSVEEQRFLGDAGDDHGPAALDDLAGDALAGGVHAAFLLSGREPVGRLDEVLARFAVQERERPAGHAHAFVEGLEDRPDHLPQVEAAIEGLADLEEQ